MKKIHRRYAEDGINWVWYTEVELDPVTHTARVLAHYRMHMEDAPHPKAIDCRWPHRVELVEAPGSNRIAHAIRLPGTTPAVWPIVNPICIFDYPFASVMPRNLSEQEVSDRS